MSIIWFLVLRSAFNKGFDVPDIAFLMISVFYVGDCILLKCGRGKK